jgi:hypothetical protein
MVWSHSIRSLPAIIMSRPPHSNLPWCSCRFKSILLLSHSGTFTFFLVSNSSVDLVLCFRLLSCWKVNLSPSVCWKADWTKFPSRILPVLSSIPFHFILKNVLVLADDRHTNTWCSQHYAWKYEVLFSDVLCWICHKHNALYSGPKVYFLAILFGSITFLNIFILYRLPSFYSFIWILWSNYNVVDAFLVLSSNSLSFL